MSARQDSDNLAWDRHDESCERERNDLRSSTNVEKVMTWAQEVVGEKDVVLVPPLIAGGFHLLYPIHIKSSSTAINAFVRLPCLDDGLFRKEKTLAEVATTEYISRHTKLQVPRTLHYEIESKVGPIMIIQDLGTQRSMSHALQQPDRGPDDWAILDPNISDTKVEGVYGQMARCLLQLAQLTFHRIGSLNMVGSGLSVMRRPLTINMSNMIQLANVPHAIFPWEHATFESADDWYKALADMQMATLVFQHNDIVSSEDDCRTKFVARRLFHRLAKEGRLSTFGFAGGETSGDTLPIPDGQNNFRLWFDDFRPANVLIDENDQVVGAIDWEFSYVAPTQFILDPPWWLLLEVPEMWDDGIDDWASVYESRLQVWLSELEQAEQELSPGSFLLSAYMRQSWASGRFWLNYAARKSWAFDAIYWKYLDERFFGEREHNLPLEELWKSRAHLLSEKERSQMEELVQVKMEESKERILVSWEAQKAKEHLSRFLS